MSLNGLDHPDVQDAYEAAVAEAGGWFFLKYTSRDSVDLLGRGKGGVHEARAAVAKYTEASPLYGVIVYRRRKVLIKLVPENTSRLLLARTAVHFQDVVEKYSPYEALLEITSSESLTDTHLAASFPLHTATPSASSNRLDEITEDGEDPGPPRPTLTTSSPNGSYLASQRYRFPARGLHPDRSPTTSPISPRPTSPTMSAGKPSMSQFLVRNTSGKPSITSLGSESLASTAGYAASEVSARETEPSMSTLSPSNPDLTTSEHAPSDPSIPAQEPKISDAVQRRDITQVRPSTSTSRQSSVSSVQPATRPSTSAQTRYEDDLFDFLKPKPKLGPRPVAASEKTKRPTVASISSMPAPYRYSMRKADPVRSPSSDLGAPPSPAPTRALPTPPPIPDAPEYTPRPLSRGSLKSLPQSHKSTTMTPDKLRLMKAVELRKRQLRKSNPHAGDFVPPIEEPVPAVPIVPDLSPPKEEAIPANDTAEAIETVDPVPVATQEGVADEPTKASTKADSGIEMDYEKGDHQEAKRSFEEPVIEEQKSEEAKLEASDGQTREPEVVEAPKDGLPFIAEPSERPLEPSEQPPKHDVSDSQPLLLESQDSLTGQSTPQLEMPGAFSNPISPASEVDEPTLDPVENSEEEVKEATVAEMQPVMAVEPVDGIPAAPAEETKDIPQIVAESEPRPTTPPAAADESIHEDDKSSNDDLDIYEMSPKRKNSDLARRRQGFVEPIHTESDGDSMSDDALIEELQSATVQEATPVMVSTASPVHEYFSRLNRRSGASSPFEAPSTPAEAMERRTPSPASVEAPEENTLEAAPRQIQPPTIPPRTVRPVLAIGQVPIGLKRNVSSEISKRIQALATTSRDSSRDNGPIFGSTSRPMSPAGNETSRPTRSPAHSRNNSYRSLLRGSTKVIQQPPGRLTPTPPPQPLSQPVWTVQRDPVTNRESVSVTARIIRPVTSSSINSHADTIVEDAPQSSPSTSVPRTGLSSQSPTPQRIDTNPNSPTSIHASSPLSPTFSRTSRDTARAPSQASQYQQQKSLPSPTMDDFPPPPQGLVNHRHNRSSISTNFADETSAPAAPKEGSRTSRFFKRMSIIGSKRRSGMQQVPEGSGLAAAITNAQPSNKDVEVHTLMPVPVVVGHLNVQFPDSLLWKHRIVAIDDTGCIKFTAPPQTSSPSSSTALAPARRFQLSDFSAPYVPDVDRQELPNSIMLDFLDAGTTLQMACEDPVSLVRVSHVLKTYWRAWARVSGASTTL